MAIFGFLGRFPDASAVGLLIAHGKRTVIGGVEEVGPGTAGREAHGFWAPQLVTEGGISVMLEGHPRWRDQPSSEDGLDAARILNAYQRSGEGLLSSLGGRFALVVVDRTARRAMLAVDPMGIERLTYTVFNDNLVFGTSAEAVAHCPTVAAPLDLQSIFDYLLLHVVPAPKTIFKSVHKLRAGNYALFESGRLDVRRYWQPQFDESRGASSDALRTELHTCLRAAVVDCNPTDRSGAFLSGGLDSSSVAGILSEVRPRPARTFSIGFGYPQYDELSYARIANARFGCRGFEHTVSGADIAAAFPQVARAFDEPFGNSSALPVYYCARLARENGVDHLLAGDGGDELFAGNSRYAEQQVFEWYQCIPAPLRRATLEPLIAHWPASLDFGLVRKARGYIEKANTPLPTRLESWNVIYRAGAAEILHPDLVDVVDPQAPLARMHEVWDAAPGKSTLNHMLYYDWQYTLADNDLRKVETMSALAGVRVSYPMLHPSVIEMSMRVPPHLKMPGRKLRYFYKQAMRGFLPQEIIEKKKHGFGLPFGLWLAEYPALRDLIFANLAGLRARRLIRPEFIDKLLRLHQADDASYYGVFVWVLAMLEQWLQEHRLRVAL